jgi:hypothetical protein
MFAEARNLSPSGLPIMCCKVRLVSAQTHSSSP